MIFIIDTNVEDLAVKEAMKLNIPIVAIVDTNSDPTGINFPIPGNDDARRAINLYCELIMQTVLDAQKNMTNSEKIDEKTQFQMEEASKKELINEKPEKKGKTKKKEETKIVKKVSKSIFEKVKSLTSKKTK